MAVGEAAAVVSRIVYEPEACAKRPVPPVIVAEAVTWDHVRVRCWTSDNLDRESSRYLASHRFCAITNSKLGEIYCLSAKTVPAGVWIAKSEELGLPLPREARLEV